MSENASVRPGTSSDHAEFVQVYGNDHSPWVQAVLFGLHERQIGHVLLTAPPLRVFLHSGVLMPAARIDGAPWLLDSGRILEALGFSPVGSDDCRALQDFFLGAALNRADDGWQFWLRFSRARDGSPDTLRRCWNHFWRTFSLFYFFSMIRLGRRRAAEPTLEDRLAGLSYWEERLSEASPFLAGKAPATVDFQLFGLVQMCASIPGPTLDLLRTRPELSRFREWVAAMQVRFRDYGHLYSADYFEPPAPSIATTTTLERICYWTGALVMWLALPITLPLTLFLVQSIRRRGLLST